MDGLSENRREAMSRARAIADRITDPSKTEVVRMHLDIVRDPFYNDKEAWDSVQSLYLIDPMVQPCSGCGAAGGSPCYRRHEPATRIYTW